MMEVRNRLLGTWHLARWESRYDDGRVIFPMGEDAIGFLIYAADGYMAATLSRRDRAPFVTGEMLSAEIAEKARGWDSYFSYVGRYEVGEGKVTHYVEASQFPNWVGDAQLRLMNLDGERLELATEPQKSRRGTQTSHLMWQRAQLP